MLGVKFQGPKKTSLSLGKVLVVLLPPGPCLADLRPVLPVRHLVPDHLRQLLVVVVVQKRGLNLRELEAFHLVKVWTVGV